MNQLIQHDRAGGQGMPLGLPGKKPLRCKAGDLVMVTCTRTQGVFGQLGVVVMSVADGLKAAPAECHKYYKDDDWVVQLNEPPTVHFSRGKVVATNQFAFKDHQLMPIDPAAEDVDAEHEQEMSA